MIRYIVQRAFLAAITVFAVSILSFIIIQLPPGDYISSYIAAQQASNNPISQEAAENLRRLYGLNDPLYVQYLKWVSQMTRGNFGVSMEWGRPVDAVIGDRLWMTVVISLAAFIFTWLVALPIGIYSAVNKYSLGDYIFTFVGFIGLAIPSFLLALVLMYVGFKYFNANVGGLFSADYSSAPWSMGKMIDLLKHLPLPAVILGLAGTAGTIRIMRANLLDELRKPYVITARAKGLPYMRAVLRYPVRVALNPFASTIGYELPQLVSGSIIISLVLSLPTVGPVLLKALVSQDMFLAGTIILMLGTLTVIGTFLSDLLLMWIDPRIRLED